ncbi:hypothetical protein [Paenibacillus spongiae]|uniref:Uncharacterized protein n=1 Tax=Paenibacillus spongiae TaxID=2909671 RepID=A0ABY5S855_9BACL|nr:hypothetical protein [Paenibacillus spongiae]UVI30092.1 hypothetical protein L1F29_32755 [Paenibacillus spongiae]
MFEVTINLYQDWIDTVKEVFRGSGHPLPDDMDEEDIAVAYFMQTMDEDAAVKQSAANKQRFDELEQTINHNLETLIIPDIRTRTNYQDNQFRFKWVYQQGEHIIEELSQYRIPLGE